MKFGKIDTMLGKKIRKMNYGSKDKGLHLAKKADEKIFVCSECNLCFEYDYHTKKYFYYEDFPTYGKTRKPCPKPTCSTSAVEAS